MRDQQHMELALQQLVNSANLRSQSATGHSREQSIADLYRINRKANSILTEREPKCPLTTGGAHRDDKRHFSSTHPLQAYDGVGSLSSSARLRRGI
jgi:hypothetical protein